MQCIFLTCSFGVEASQVFRETQRLLCIDCDYLFTSTLLVYFRGKGTPNQNLVCCVHYFKIINIVLKSTTCILKQIVWGTKKWHQIFNRLCVSWDIDQNMQNIVMIDNPRTTWPTYYEMSILFFSFLTQFAPRGTC